MNYTHFIMLFSGFVFGYSFGFLVAVLIYRRSSGGDKAP